MYAAAQIIIGVAAVVTAVTVVTRAHPVRRLWRTNVAEPITEWHRS